MPNKCSKTFVLSFLIWAISLMAQAQESGPAYFYEPFALGNIHLHKSIANNARMANAIKLAEEQAEEQNRRVQKKKFKIVSIGDEEYVVEAEQESQSSNQ